MENYDNLLQPISRRKRNKCNTNNIRDIIYTANTIFVLTFLFTIFGLLLSLFIIENQFIIEVTPFVKGLQVPEFNMTEVVPTLNKISSIIDNVCKQPEFQDICN